MFIDADAITVLIEKYKTISAGQWPGLGGCPGELGIELGVRALEGLIDDELEALEIQRLEFENEAAGDEV